MRGAFNRLVEETWILTLAAGIALGYCLLHVGQAVAQFVTIALDRQPSDLGFSTQGLGGLTVMWGRHELDFGVLVGALVETLVIAGVVVAVVSVVQRYEDSLLYDDAET
jgi:large-conductance mechanosensitive channel